MIVDLLQVEDNPVQSMVDVCICGAGVAGIVLALELAERYRVVLLEAGGLEFSAQSQALYAGDIVGRDYFALQATRLRYFGGTSNHWGGWCRPLDEQDFRARSYSPLSGWPISAADLAPYREKTCDILDIPSGAAFEPDLVGSRISEVSDLEPIQFMFSPPTRFGPKYEADIRAHPNLTCLLNANLVDIRLDADGHRIETFRVKSYADADFSISARTFVLAAGGIENPRLLLCARNQVPEGIGNARGLVGRYFCEHLHQTLGGMLLEEDIKADLRANWIHDFPQSIRFFSPTPTFLERERVLNFGLRFVPSRTSVLQGSKGAVKDLICSVEWLETAAEWVRGSDVLCFDGEIQIACEQALNPDSRVRLGTGVDRFGMPRTVLDWRLSELDRRTLRSAAMAMGKALALSDVGRLRVQEWVLSDTESIPGIGQQETGGNHHMCTTRMAASPDDGVVDADQRVFGIENLFVAGSSVFSTVGHANPTFTIVQTTLRLAQHLKTRLAA